MASAYQRPDLYLLLGIAAVIVIAMTRPTNGPVIAPIIIQGEANRVHQEAPLPQARSRATVPTMPTGQPVESAVFHPGDRVSRAGVYFPFWQDRAPRTDRGRRYRVDRCA